MQELSPEAKQFIKLHSANDEFASLGGLLHLTTLNLYNSINTDFSPKERIQIFPILRKAFYINNFLEWKLFAFIGERHLIQNEFKELCDKWELLEALITTYNEQLKDTAAPDAVGKKMIEEAAQDFAPITIFKSGKLQLQNRHIQREFEKLRNRNKNRIKFHSLIADTLQNFIDENGLSDFISDDINNFIKQLNSDIAHAPKYSMEEFFIEYAFVPDSPEKSNAQKYAVYPAFNEGTEPPTEREKQLAKKFLFSDLEQIEKWQADMWGI